MNKITIILGPQGSGKTLLARELVKRKKSVWMKFNYSPHPFVFSGVRENTDTIVFDECLKKIKDLRSLIQSEYILVERKAKKPFQMQTPDLIIISNVLVEHDLNSFNHKNLNVIKLWN